MRFFEFMENLVLDKFVHGFLMEGCDSRYTRIEDYSLLLGSLTIQRGSLAVENLVIR
jgi:hypothetical protein